MTTLEAPAAPTTTFPGRNTVAPRAVKQVVQAVTAEALGVAPRRVDVNLDDLGGMLLVTAAAPIQLTALGVVARRDAGTQTPNLLDRVSAAQRTIQERVRDITGSQVAAVNLRITGADLKEGGRVL